MILESTLAAVIVLAATASPKAHSTRHPVAGPLRNIRTETLWRGAPGGDSLFVRARWSPTTAGSACPASKGIQLADSAFIGPTCLEYSIEDSHGRTRHRGTISGYTTADSPEPEFYWCCDEMSASATPWRDGVVVALTATGYGCEPAGDCSSQLFCYLQGPDSVAVSDWTDTPWQSATADSIVGWVNDGCFTYGMTLLPVVRDSIIRFQPRLPEGARVGDILSRAATDYVNCYWVRTDHESVTVELLPTGDAEHGERIIVGIDDPVELQTALVRVAAIAKDTFTPELSRVEAIVGQRHGYLTRDGLRALGFGVER